MGRKLPFILLALFLLTAPLYCQQRDAAEAEEYGEQEFSPFLQNLRRAEIVMLGSFPVTLFLSLELYDIYRYIDRGGDPQYAPWPFRPPDAAPYSTKENLVVFLTAVSASLLIAVADYIVARVKEKRPEP